MRSIVGMGQPMDYEPMMVAAGIPSHATAANRLVNAIPWLRAATPGLYDGLDVPLAADEGPVQRP